MLGPGASLWFFAPTDLVSVERRFVYYARGVPPLFFSLCLLGWVRGVGGRLPVVQKPWFHRGKLGGDQELRVGRLPCAGGDQELRAGSSWFFAPTDLVSVARRFVHYRMAPRSYSPKVAT